MNKFFGLIVSALIVFNCAFYSNAQVSTSDSAQVDILNEKGYKARLTDPRQTIVYGNKSLILSKKINYKNGMGEAYRILGIGNFYLNKGEKAIEHYLKSISIFKESDNLEGQAKTYNNLGTLYRDVNYVEKALGYYNRSLKLAKKQNMGGLIAGINLNMGNIYYTMGNYNAALKSFQNSRISFTRLNDSVNLVVSMQNLGNVYYKLRNYEESEHTLLEAISKAKKLDLNNSIASMSIFLSNIYIDKKDYKKAEQLLIESEQYVKHSNDLKLEQDFLYTSYHFEDGRKNYYKALQFLKKVYKKDSIANNATMTEQLTRQEVQFKERAKARENELIIARQKNNKILFWASSVVSALLLVVVGLLYYSNTRKIKTNKQLTILNSEILQQKEELDWINQRLEKIIDERTKDLQIKNQKLSEYSWHLSHQIRGPVATMKGLMLLEKDRLIENDEFVIQLGKCLVDIDEKITNINEALHDVKRERLGNSAAG